MVVLWAYNCLWQHPADWKIKNFCCHTKALRSIITLSNVAVSFTIIRACVYQIWGLGCKWFKSYDRKRDFTLFWKLTGSFCTAVLSKIRLCYWLANQDDYISEIANIKGLIYVDIMRSRSYGYLFYIQDFYDSKGHFGYFCKSHTLSLRFEI